MKSNAITQDREALLRLSKAMTPKERLVAFFKHSRLVCRLSLAGKLRRKAVLPRAKGLAVK